MKNVFNKGDLKRCSVKLPWWIRFLLWFKKSYITCDLVEESPPCFLMTKFLFGKMYIIKEWNSNTHKCR